MKNAITLMATLVLVIMIASILDVMHVKGEDLEVQDVTEVEVNVECIENLPQVEYLGEGPGDYTTPPGYSQFVVKTRNGQFFEVYDGPTYTVLDKSPHRRDRVWVCNGICDQFAKIHKSHLDLGNRSENSSVDLLFLDDDDDNRYHWWALNHPMDPYEMVQDNRMVEYLNYTFPESGKWWLHTEDSGGVALLCNSEDSTPTNTPSPTFTNTPEPSPTFTSTPEPTATNTEEPTATQTPIVTPIVTPEATETPVASPSPTVEPTATPPVDPAGKDKYTYLPIIICGQLSYIPLVQCDGDFTN